MTERKLSWGEVKETWFDCTVGIVCLCGEEICVDAQNGPEDNECEKCGRQYGLYTYMTVIEPDAEVKKDEE